MAFTYRNKELILQKKNQAISLKDWGFHKETPYYVYDKEGVLERLHLFRSSFSHPVSLHYAMKANTHKELLKAFSKEGVGVDVVSGGELELSLKAGFSPEKVVFSGVGKTIKELKKAIEVGVRQINVESPGELQRIGEISQSLGKKASVAFRMNPDVEAITHPYIKTGFRENKFGMDQSFIPQLIEGVQKFASSVDLVGLTLHIGSQIHDIQSIKEAILKTLPIYKELKTQGFPLKSFDIGGGVGVAYEKEMDEKETQLIKNYGSEMSGLFKGMDCEILCEPGRILVARFGLLVTQVQYIKESPYKKFVVVDTGMHHLMRPSLYQAYHRILPLVQKPKPLELYDVVGPICESSDVLGYERLLPQVCQGEYLAIADVGAYGFVMAHNYNAHSLPKEYIL